MVHCGIWDRCILRSIRLVYYASILYVVAIVVSKYLWISHYSSGANIIDIRESYVPVPKATLKRMGWFLTHLLRFCSIQIPESPWTLTAPKTHETPVRCCASRGVKKFSENGMPGTLYTKAKTGLPKKQMLFLWYHHSWQTVTFLIGRV